MFKQVYYPLQCKMHIGLSISRCIPDICEGIITPEQVACIVAGTNIRNDEEWEKMLRAYASTIWSDCAVNAVHYARYFRDKDLIVQPRKFGMPAFMIGDGHWLVEDTTRSEGC